MSSHWWPCSRRLGEQPSVTVSDGIPALGRGLYWINGFNKHLLGTSCVLGLCDAETKDSGEVVLHLWKVGQLEDVAGVEGGGLGS